MTAKLSELPEGIKKYKMTLTSRETFLIDGDQKIAITNTPRQFVELRDGSTINKSYIISFTLERDETRSAFNKLPERERQKLGGSLRLSDSILINSDDSLVEETKNYGKSGSI